MCKRGRAKLPHPPTPEEARKTKQGPGYPVLAIMTQAPGPPVQAGGTVGGDGARTNLDLSRA